MAESFHLDADLSGASAAFDASGVTLGASFLFAVDGQVTHIRFRGTPTQSGGTFTGGLFQITDDDPPAGSGDGTLLGSATFGTITGDAWNTVALSPPVDVVADTPYRAAVYSSVGRYMARGSFYAAGNITRGNIVGLQDGAAPTGFTSLRNGTFFYADPMSYPQDAFNAAAYFVDVVFEPAGGPVDPAEGTLAANLDLAAALTGARDSQGALAGTLDLAAALTGARASEGALAGSLGLQAALSGARESLGSLAAGLTLSPSLTGARASLGSLAAGLTFAVSLTGTNGESGRPVAPFPFPPRAGSGFPWPPRPVKSFQEVEEP